ncbi:MAG: cysteine desulfurase [Actinomycetia bacterium]|nr:cysteine desulfurase [Actinomycetes bacterium]MCP3911662.1 cysteine desulfurase [Actinomycetes bacterium]MCP4086931.1 cysteine desulfurase [Actinomycetes bacterium]
MVRHYLDHASTSPLRAAARDALVEWLDTALGDPGRVHHEGMTARAALEHARDQVAAFLGARPREVVFTSGATESIVTAIRGAASRGPHQVISAVEHSGVRAAAEATGSEVTVVPVDSTGRVDPDEVLAAITPDTALVSVQYGNHEVGTIQPVEATVAGCRDRGVLIHVDAAQAAGRIPLDLGSLGADLVSVSGHKLGGPTGTGVLMVRRGLRIDPLLVGGDQERARRAGLENVPALMGLGAAAAELSESLDRERGDSVRLTNRLRAGLDAIDGLTQYGHPEHRLPHLVCVGFAKVEPQPVLMGLDRAGIAAHSGSACSSEALEPSPVLDAMGVDAMRSLRLSVGWSTTDADIDATLEALPRILQELV